MAFVFSDKYVQSFVSEADLLAVSDEVNAAHKTLCEKTGEGNDFLGWVELPVSFDRAEVAQMKKAAERSSLFATF